MERSFKEIIKDCRLYQDENNLNKCFNELINSSDAEVIVNILKNKYQKDAEYIQKNIKNLIKKHSDLLYAKNFRGKLEEYIKIREEVTSIIDKRIHNVEFNKVDKADKEKAVIDYTDVVFAFLERDISAGLNSTQSARYPMDVGEAKTKKINYIFHLIKKYYTKLKSNGYLHEFIDKIYLLSGDIYELIARKLISGNSKKEGNINYKKVSFGNSLTLDFDDKIRYYLSALLSDDTIQTKKEFCKKYTYKSQGAYEHEVPYICELFKKERGQTAIFELVKELKEYNPNKFAKIYDVHTIPNVILYFLILDILYETDLKDDIQEINITDIMERIFLDKKKWDYDEIKEEKSKLQTTLYKNFRKNILLPRLNELAQYGFIKINKNRYSLYAKNFTTEQKELLKNIIPDFINRYPFVSLGHFLMNRIKIQSNSKYYYNISNILDDSIAYDLYNAIKSKKNAQLIFQNYENITIMPKELIIDKNDKFLLKVRDVNNKEYALNKIKKVQVGNENKSENLIFSEIYCFYYQIFQDLINEYRTHKKYNIEEIIASKYALYESIINNQTMKIVAPLIVGLKNVSIPLTNLELRWLKTITLSPKFNSEHEKILNNLICDIQPFDLSVFKGFQI